jgi:hypothetical protein
MRWFMSWQIRSRNHRRTTMTPGPVTVLSIFPSEGGQISIAPATRCGFLRGTAHRSSTMLEMT